jgi:hypothetical protein
MNENIKCSCGNVFKGVKGKEDTCPDCLNFIINVEDILRQKLIKNEKNIQEDYKIFLINNCTDDADLETDFEIEDWENLRTFWIEFNIDIRNKFPELKEVQRE